MLENLFTSILEMSYIASLVIIFVLIIRVVLIKAPKVFSYMLWLVVLVRLLLPFSFESSIAILPTTTKNIHLENVVITNPEFNTIVNTIDYSVNQISATNPVTAVSNLNSMQSWFFTISCVWVFGLFVIIIIALTSIIKLKSTLIGNSLLKDNIYLCDNINSAFVYGFFKPKIYLPSSSLIEEREYIIEHEQYHIKRLDHIVRLFSFIAVCVHWFNPIVWAAYFLSIKDMEMSCDEKIIKSKGIEIRSSYSKSLLKFSAKQNKLVFSSLAFGENATMRRIKNIMNYKKPLISISIITFVIVLFASIILGTNQQNKDIVKYDNIDNYIQNQFLDEKLDIISEWSNDDYLIKGYILNKSDIGYFIFEKNYNKYTYKKSVNIKDGVSQPYQVIKEITLEDDFEIIFINNSKSEIKEVIQDVNGNVYMTTNKNKEVDLNENYSMVVFTLDDKSQESSIYFKDYKGTIFSNETDIEYFEINIDQYKDNELSNKYQITEGKIVSLVDSILDVELISFKEYNYDDHDYYAINIYYEKIAYSESFNCYIFTKGNSVFIQYQKGKAYKLDDNTVDILEELLMEENPIKF